MSISVVKIEDFSEVEDERKFEIFTQQERMWVAADDFINRSVSTVKRFGRVLNFLCLVNKIF